jgi:SAM-dependent methyltransferase
MDEMIGTVGRIDGAIPASHRDCRVPEAPADDGEKAGPEGRISSHSHASSTARQQEMIALLCVFRLSLPGRFTYISRMTRLLESWHSLTLRKRYHLLNYLVRSRGYTRYLEIGVRNPRITFNRIRVARKEAVDPAPLAPLGHVMRSDDFFSMMDANGRAAEFDLVFIDGLHLADQVERDVENSLRYLSPGGTIVLHDCNPPNEEAQAEFFDGTQKVWTGTVWKAWAKLRATRADLSMCVVDIDLGCGVVQRGSQTCYPAPVQFDQMTYRFLTSNRRELLNLVSAAQFLSLEGRTSPLLKVSENVLLTGQ